MTVAIFDRDRAVRYDFEGGLPPRPIPTIYGLILVSGFIQGDFQMIFCRYQHICIFPLKKKIKIIMFEQKV